MKKIISILLVLTIFSSLFLLTACDDSNANNTNIIPQKANYVVYNHVTTTSPYYKETILVNAEKFTDNYLVIHVLDHNFRTTMALVNKNQVKWYYYPEDFFVKKFHLTYDEIIKNEQKYSLDEMKNMICEDEDVIIYAEDGFLAIEDKSGMVRYLGHQNVYYTYSDN